MTDRLTDGLRDIVSYRVASSRLKRKDYECLIELIFFAVGYEQLWSPARNSCELSWYHAERVCHASLPTTMCYLAPHVPPCNASNHAPPYASAYHIPPCTATYQYTVPNAAHPNIERPAERCFELIGKRKLLKNLIQLSTRALYIPTLENKMKRWGKSEME